MSALSLNFDFEPYVTKMLPELDNLDTESLLNPFGAFRGDPKHRTVVCRHWLLGLCQNGFSCGYLHRLDRSKMPACKHGKLCKIKNCHLKHMDEQEVSVSLRNHLITFKFISAYIYVIYTFSSILQGMYILQARFLLQWA